MALPDVPVTVKDGGLGALPASTSKACVTMGVCSNGIVGTLYGFSDIGTLTGNMGQGPGVESVAVKLAIAGGPQYFIPINPSQAGSASAVTHAGGGAATVTVGIVPAQSIVFQCMVAGTLGTAQFQVTIGSNAPFLVTSAAGWSSTGYAIPGTLTTWTFTAGSYVAGGTPDIYTQTTTSTVVVHTQGAGPAVPTAVSSPMDAYTVVLTVKTAGVPGTGAFTWSLDGGNNVSPTIAIPGGGTYAIPNSGILLTWSGAAAVPDTYSFTTTAAGFNNTDVTNSFTSLFSNSTQWSLGHLVGMGANSAAAATTASTVDTQVQLASTNFRFVRWVVECPTSEADSAIMTAFQNFSSVNGRVLVHAGDAAVQSPISGRILRRNGAWVHVARLAAINAGQDAADVSLGPLPLVQSLYFDSFTDGGILDGARFSTLRTLQGKQGYFVANSRTMAPAGSDYTYTALGRVMDQICTIARAALLPYLNGKVRVNTTTGFIDERDASRIEKNVNAQLKAGVVDTGDATQATIQVSRTTSILSTNNMPVVCAGIPNGYSRNIPLTVGFNNPALAA